MVGECSEGDFVLGSFLWTKHTTLVSTEPITFVLPGQKDPVCWPTQLTLVLSNEAGDVKSEQTVDVPYYTTDEMNFTFYQLNKTVDDSPLLEVQYTARVENGKLSKTTQYALECVGGNPRVTPKAPKDHAFVQDETKTDLEVNIENGCSSSEVVVVMNGEESTAKQSNGFITVDVTPDTEVKWNAYIVDVTGIESKTWGGSTFYVCGKMEFTSNASDTIEITVESNSMTNVDITWPEVVLQSQVCDEAAKSLGVIKYFVRVQEPTGAISEKNVTTNKLSYYVSPGKYALTLRAYIDDELIEGIVNYDVLVEYSMPTGSIVGIAVGCCAGVVLIVLLALLIVCLVKRACKARKEAEQNSVIFMDDVAATSGPMAVPVSMGVAMSPSGVPMTMPMAAYTPGSGNAMMAPVPPPPQDPPTASGGAETSSSGVVAPPSSGGVASS